MKDRKITIRVTEEMAQQIEEARGSGYRREEQGRRRDGKSSMSEIIQAALTEYLRTWK